MNTGHTSVSDDGAARLRAPAGVRRRAAPRMLACCLAAGLLTARNNSAGSVEPAIEINVSFIEIQHEASAGLGISWEVETSNATSVLLATPDNLGEVLLNLSQQGQVDLLSAPKLTTRSGETGTVKVVTEYRYPTDVDIQRVVSTNDTSIELGVMAVPSNYETRDVGVTLTAAPTYDPQREMIDVALKTEVVTEPTWREHTATYQGLNGSTQTVSLAQPFFHTRGIDLTLSLRNGSTAVVGGMITGEKRQVEERTPILGSIPWLGRWFRSTHDIDDRRNLFITITARVAEGSGGAAVRTTPEAPAASIVVKQLAKATTSWDGATLPAYSEGQPEITMLRITIPPGARLPVHLHPVINAGILLSGQLTVETTTGKTLHIQAGDAIVEVVNTLHYGRNDGAVPAEIFVVYAGTVGAPVTVNESK